MAVTEILIFIMFIRFGTIISFLFSGKGGNDTRALFQIEMNVTFLTGWNNTHILRQVDILCLLRPVRPLQSHD